MDFLLDLALPATDAGAIAQAVIAGMALIVASWLVRKRPEPRLFVIGLAVLSFSLMALRAVH
ncbi:MAG: hypothetical protein P1T08_00575 [Acidimicrobiia bacterium]|nr:hypothetical protein [Acidimicrobiia bacterium]